MFFVIHFVVQNFASNGSHGMCCMVVEIHITAADYRDFYIVIFLLFHKFGNLDV